MSEDDYVYCTSEDGNFTDFCTVMDDLNHKHEVGEKAEIYRGVKNKCSHSDFFPSISLDILIEDMQESALVEMGEHAEKYLCDINSEKINDLKRVITEWLDKNAEINFYNVAKVEQIEVTVE